MTGPKTIIIAIHSLFSSDGKPVSGTGASLFDLLSSKNIPFTVLHFPIYGSYRILYEQHAPSGVRRDQMSKTPASLLLRTLIESYIALTSLVKAGKTSLYIGIDPLNAVWGIVGRYAGLVNRVIYYTADYADSRFGNRLLNGIYHSIDRFCIRHADQVWNVSTRIFEHRVTQGVSKEKNYFVPNAPVGVHEGRGAHHAHWMVIVGTSTTSLNYEVVLDALEPLTKKYPDMRLHIIGELNFPKAIKNKITRWQRKKTVVLHGPLSREKVHEFLSTAGIGLALYIDKDPWTRYGDSMKIREYLAAGLPVITTDVVSTSDIIREFRCGVVIRPVVSNFVRAIDSVYAGIYPAMRRRAIQAAQAYSFERMVRKPLKAMGITV